MLHVVGSMDRGGAESWIMNLLRSVDRDKYQFEFCCTRGEPGVFKEEIESLGGVVHLCSVSPFHSFRRRFLDILKTNKYDVVHSHVWLFSGIILRVANKFGVSSRVAHSHTSRSKDGDSLYRAAYQFFMRRLIAQNSTACLACAEQSGVALYGQYWGSSEKYKVLYCSINNDFFGTSYYRKTSKEDLGISANTFVIGNVGNLRRPKNHSFFLDIAVQFLKSCPDSIFYVAGEGELREELEDKAQRLGIANKVVFAGVRNDVPALMTNVFDCFLFPSLYEGMPLTLVEAAAAGLYTVCSDTITSEATAVNPELFEVLSLENSPAQWAKALKRALEKKPVDPSEAFDIVENSHFTNKHCLLELNKVYVGDVEG